MTAVAVAAGGCWYAFRQNRQLEINMARTMRDMESLAKSEVALKQLQEKLECEKLEKRQHMQYKEELEQKVNLSLPLIPSSQAMRALWWRESLYNCSQARVVLSCFKTHVEQLNRKIQWKFCIPSTWISQSFHGAWLLAYHCGACFSFLLLLQGQWMNRAGICSCLLYTRTFSPVCAFHVGIHSYACCVCIQFRFHFEPYWQSFQLVLQKV